MLTSISGRYVLGLLGKNALILISALRIMAGWPNCDGCER